MLRKIFVGSAVALLLALGAGTSSAQAATWFPVFYFGTQTYCTQAGNLGQQIGTLTAGAWKCDSGWLMVRARAGS